MRSLIIIVALAVCFHTGIAQTDQKREALNMLQQMADTYRQASGLSFSVSFRYATEDKPEEWLDSMSGHFTVNGQQYKCELNNTETICTGGYVIMLFKDDQLMYLTKPVDTARADMGGLANPVARLEKYLADDSTIRWTVENVSKQKRIVLQFNAQAAFKRVEFYINKKTGLLERMISVVKSDQLYDPSVRHAVDALPSYAIVEAFYSGHKTGSVDRALFDANNYFTKEANEYKATDAYKSYSIFLGSSNL